MEHIIMFENEDDDSSFVLKQIDELQNKIDDWEGSEEEGQQTGISSYETEYIPTDELNLTFVYNELIKSDNIDKYDSLEEYFKDQQYTVLMSLDKPKQFKHYKWHLIKITVKNLEKENIKYKIKVTGIWDLV